eukprot:CAMPEP_0203918914 /NCGR_PEP_ID=MMETSP0359-20131031/59412_1 /ASSEMBLY_ACC=CAM_ASM_000338 /TAXON_ID=268821 /ORGANISM="Scrippsiella Hangoei, Strain SHTV-5" /LENGTH=35 /DNA_ID= /DNA_START= /DNA_END= /DNA_ORIENTATION=
MANRQAGSTHGKLHKNTVYFRMTRPPLENAWLQFK